MAHATLFKNGILLGSATGQDLTSVTTTVRATGSALDTAIATEQAVREAITSAVGTAITINANGFQITGGTTNSQTLLVEGSTDGNTYKINQSLETTDSVTFGGITDSALTANRLVASGTAGVLASVATLSSWVTGTSNQITVTDGSGATAGQITLSLPQSIATTSSVTFGALTVGTLAGMLTATAGVVSAATADTDYQKVIVWNDGLKYATATGIADIDYNTTNLKITATQIDTIQGISSAASPTFTGLTLSGLSNKFVTATAGVLGSQAKIAFGDILSTDIQFAAAGLTGSDSQLATAKTIKDYIDATAQGLTLKMPARVATGSLTTVAINLATAPAAIDNVTLTAGDRVLVQAQGGNLTTPHVDNGVYVFNGAGSAMTRALDFDGTPASETQSGAFCFITEGDTFSDQGFTLVTNNPIAIGTTPLLFGQFSGAGSFNAGNGLVKVGNTMHIRSATAGTAGGIAVSSDDIAIDVNATNLKIDAVTFKLNTIQDIATTSSVTFGALTVGTLAGMLKATAGVVSAATADADYQKVVVWGDGLKYATSTGTADVDLHSNANLVITANQLDTVQGIKTTSSPQFTGLTLTGTLAVTGVTTVTGGLKDANLAAASIALSDASNTGLSGFTGVTSIIGALNDLKAANATPANYATTGTSVQTADSATVAAGVGIVWNYVATDGTNLRIGTVRSVTNGTIAEYDETSSIDIGDTSPVTFLSDYSGGALRLRVTPASGTWTIKMTRTVVK